MSKRKIRDVREELFFLDSGLEHHAIRYYRLEKEESDQKPVFIEGPYAGVPAGQLRERSEQLKAEYPNWKFKPRQNS
ncbi:hypothetical protein [Stenotrophomonas phage BUCT608]|nr:hypothetical protein [Stenotrophomonas phage BUCT608]QYC97406.1 hypothetical protein [Stenotrophomonas phage BUCT608]